MPSITQALNQVNNEYTAAVNSQTKGKGSELDKDSFLLLMVTQMKNQDPLNPMDDTQYVSQLAQYSSLEQLMNLNDGMSSLTDATNNQQMLNATSYIGKEVGITGNAIGKTTEGGVTKTSTFRYAFGDNVTSGVLSVLDAQGNTVYTESIAGKQAGTTFEFNWNGLNDKGVPAADGVYNVYLSGYNAKGDPVLADQVVYANVTSVVKSDGVVMIGLDGGQLMELSNVRLVSDSEAKGGNGSGTGGEGANGNTSSNSGGNTGGSTSGSTTGSAAGAAQQAANNAAAAAQQAASNAAGAMADNAVAAAQQAVSNAAGAVADSAVNSALNNLAKAVGM